MALQIFIKKNVKGEFGSPPEDRPLEDTLDYGIINLDKPKGPTSHQISDYVKKILNINKAGHSGTLDPQVTGVQPIALGRATRIAQFLLTAPKEYVCVMHIHNDADENQLREVFAKFIGKIKQLPPIKSAVKRQERVREIYNFEILEIDGKDVLFKVKCEAGTYVRKLCIHPKTKVLTKDGLMTAENFYINHPLVYSFSNGKIIKKKPSAVQKIRSPSKLLKFTMSSGVSFIATHDHELLCSKKEGYQMIEAQALKEGNYLVKSLHLTKDSKEFVIADLLDDYYYIQQDDIKKKCKSALMSKYGSIRAMHRELDLDRKTFLTKSNYAITIRHLKLAGIYEKIKNELHTFKTQKGIVITLKELNEDFFYLLGLIASDENNTKEKKTVRYTRIKFHNKNEEIINQFLYHYKMIFPNIPISKKMISSGIWQLDTTNSFLAAIASSLGIKSPQKYSDLLPVVNAEPRLIRAFLKGYFDGDGSAYFKKKEKSFGHHTYIRFHTVNSTDAERLHQMLLKVDIPNKIFHRKVGNENKIFDVSVETISGKNKFIKEIGSNHTFKIAKFKKISSIKDNSDLHDHHHVGLHFKEHIRKKKNELYKVGGNLYILLSSQIPMTRGFYKKASKIVKLPKLDDFIVEKIKLIEEVKGTDYVYDMTIPDTHNFLIETGFVSSNCHDLGKALGTGAHMAELRRIKAGPFTEEDHLITLQDLADAFYYYTEEGNKTFLHHCIQPIEKAVSHLPKCWILDTTIISLTHGRDLAIPGISKLENFKKGEIVAIMTLKGELVALGESVMSAVEINTKEKGLAVAIKKVFMATPQPSLQTQG